MSIVSLSILTCFALSGLASPGLIPTTLRRVWAKARTKAGFPENIRLYDATRHSVASQLANQNVSIFQIQNILGHTTVKTTEKYMHKNIDSLRGALSHLSLSDNSKAIHKIDKSRKE